MRYEARAPLRIDFAGGWTDVPLYAEAEGGCVLNAAITLYARGSISRPTAGGPLAPLRGDRSYLSYRLDVPSGAGLGASAAQTLLWTTLVRSSFRNDVERVGLAEMAWSISQSLGILGGKQDEYASALGGILYLTFTPQAKATRLDVPPAFVDRLRSHLVLVYTGERRFSGAVHEAVWERYRQGDVAVRSALSGMKALAGEMRDALLTGDILAFGELMKQHWALQRTLSPAVSTPAVEGVIELAAAHGASGAKVCGAGGGGCVVAVARPGAETELREAVRRAGYRPLDFAFDTYGVFLQKG